MAAYPRDSLAMGYSKSTDSVGDTLFAVLSFSQKWVSWGAVNHLNNGNCSHFSEYISRTLLHSNGGSGCWPKTCHHTCRIQALVLFFLGLTPQTANRQKNLKSYGGLWVSAVDGVVVERRWCLPLAKLGTPNSINACVFFVKAVLKNRPPHMGAWPAPREAVAPGARAARKPLGFFAPTVGRNLRKRGPPNPHLRKWRPCPRKAGVPAGRKFRSFSETQRLGHTVRLEKGFFFCPPGAYYGCPAENCTEMLV